MKTFVNLYWDGEHVTSRRKYSTKEDAIDTAEPNNYLATVEITTSVKVVSETGK